MALWAALALANVCTMNHLVIIFYKEGHSGHGVHVHVKGKFYKRRNIRTLFGFGSVTFGPFLRHDFTMAFPDETYNDLISSGCSRSYHVLKPGGPGFTQSVTLSIIDFETRSGKPEPGIITRGFFSHGGFLSRIITHCKTLVQPVLNSNIKQKK
jgi:hypothetical protein